MVLHTPIDSAYAHAALGEQASWSLDAHLLALVIDTLRTANWQRGGGKGRRPQPIRRPGTAGRRLGRTDRDPQEVRAYLDRLRPM